MIDVEKLGREAVSIIKEKYGLPDSGLLAGGSLANIIWELVSGNKAVVNDIDIFNLTEIKEFEKETIDKKIFEYIDTNVDYEYNEYSGIHTIYETKEYYRILEAENDGVFNNISYESNTKDPGVVIKAFDINATRVGYSIDEDKIYWEKDFEDFLNSGNLKVSTMTTPAHTAIRIAKKSKELNTNLEKFELMMCSKALSVKFKDTVRHGFKDKYKDLFIKYHNILGQHFLIRENKDKTNMARNLYNCPDTIYELYSDKTEDVLEELLGASVFNRMSDSRQFLFFMRNIYGNKELSEVYKSLGPIFSESDYMSDDMMGNKEDIGLMSRLIEYAPASIRNLKGYNFKEQVRLVRKVLSLYEDPKIAISILEKLKLDKDSEIGETDKLLMELAVRVESTHPRNESKASNILYPTSQKRNRTRHNYTMF